MTGEIRKVFLKTWALKDEYNFERREGNQKFSVVLGELRAFCVRELQLVNDLG